ncbi:helix-turn-helix domain-containing protein [Enterococcus thailandicus]|uniref:helix-turn-helix domain-containing protein n=1 Tax=Enterococcus TaxID=1350 RepID=UPI0032E4A80B
MEHNELLKLLRKERNFTQEKLAEGISHRNTLSSFENGGIKISFTILLKYIKRLNISLEEYEFILNEKELEGKKKVSVELSKKYLNPFDINFANEILDMYIDTKDFYYYSLYAQYYLVREYKGDALDKNEQRKIAKKIINYLDKIQTWGRFELVIFSNCLFLFEDKYIRFNFVESIQYMKIYLDSSNYSRDLQNFIINGLSLSYTRKNEANIQLFLSELDKIISNSDDMQAKMVKNIFSLLLNHDQGFDDENEKRRIVNTLELLDEMEWVDYIEKVYT